MRILYLSSGCFDKGGISRYTRYQIESLRALIGEDHIRVYSLLGHQEDDMETPFSVAWKGHHANKSLNKVAFANRFLIDALTDRPDIIWSAHVNLSGLACAVARLVKAKCFLNIYGLEVWSGLKWDRHWGLRNVSELISDSHFTAQYVESSGLRKKGTTTVIWDAVDTARFFSAPPSKEVMDRYRIPDPSTGINILSLGRLTSGGAHKGYDRLLDVFASVQKTFKDARLIYAGKGDLIPKLQAKAASLTLAEKVFFTGSVHEDDMADVYRAAHIFSLVSDRGKGRGEGVPATPLEAAACGIPIIVGNQDGSPEAVAEGVTGYIVDPFDLELHTRRIAELIADTDRRLNMGRAAAERIRRDFSCDVFKARHNAFLTSKRMPCDD
jgi:phosphatidyl-myo-inositol dimannoside synthase